MSAQLLLWCEIGCACRLQLMCGHKSACPHTSLRLSSRPASAITHTGAAAGSAVLPRCVAAATGEGNAICGSASVNCAGTGADLGAAAGGATAQGPVPAATGRTHRIQTCVQRMNGLAVLCLGAGADSGAAAGGAAHQDPVAAAAAAAGGRPLRVPAVAHCGRRALAVARRLPARIYQCRPGGQYPHHEDAAQVGDCVLNCGLLPFLAGFSVFLAAMVSATPCSAVLCAHCRGRWQNMYLDRPHMRYDGIYVSRNTYIKVWPVPHLGQHPTF